MPKLLGNAGIVLKWCTIYPTQDYVGRSGDVGRGKAIVEAGVGGSGHLTESWSSYRCLGTSFSSALPPLGHTPQIMPAWEGHAFGEAGKKTTGKQSKICSGSLDWTSFGWYCLNPNKSSFFGHITIYVTEPTIIFDNTRLMFISTKKLYLLFSHSMNHLSFLHLYFFMCL